MSNGIIFFFFSEFNGTGRNKKKSWSNVQKLHEANEAVETRQAD